jgi:hypothetical protein
MLFLSGYLLFFSPPFVQQCNKTSKKEERNKRNTKEMVLLGFTTSDREQRQLHRVESLCG